MIHNIESPYIVFRIETNDGERNLYNVMYNKLWFKYGLLVHTHNDIVKYPNYEEDFDGMEDFDERDFNGIKFGCVGFCNILHWFGTMWEEMNKDFNIMVYRVKDVEMGKSGYQCIFKDEDIISKSRLYEKK